jgi:hypothetical protein
MVAMSQTVSCVAPKHLAGPLSVQWVALYPFTKHTISKQNRAHQLLYNLFYSPDLQSGKNDSTHGCEPKSLQA